MKNQKRTKKRNPADLTKRNNDARKKIEVSLTKRVKWLEMKVDLLMWEHAKRQNTGVGQWQSRYNTIQPKRSRK